jgi:hypothetical protein
LPGTWSHRENSPNPASANTDDNIALKSVYSTFLVVNHLKNYDDDDDLYINVLIQLLQSAQYDNTDTKYMKKQNKT